ncbi:MAG: hypothetical protein QM757_23965 [Paludibaculum sp.]
MLIVAHDLPLDPHIPPAHPARRSGSAPAHAPGRLRIEHLGEAAASPDGQLFAFVRIRARTSAANSMRDFMSGQDRADVWIAPASGPARSITNGATDGSGFFQPAWSPDGRRLAMLSTRGNMVRLWVWTRATGTLRLAADETVEVARPVWMSPTKLLCATPPPGRQPGVDVLETQAPRRSNARLAPGLGRPHQHGQRPPQRRAGGSGSASTGTVASV